MFSMADGKIEYSIIWIGKYQECMNNFRLFGSISKFGTEKANHFVYDPNKNGNYESYIVEKINYFIKISSNFKFYFYDQYLAYKINNYINIIDSLIGVNPINILTWLNNKSITREWIRNIVRTPETIVLSNEEIELNHLKNIFAGFRRFVAQNMVSSGGHKTFLIDENHTSKLESDLYIVSPYYEPSLSVNITSILFQNDFCVFPVSVQIVEEENGNLLYKGSDFLGTQLIPQNILCKLEEIVYKILKQLTFLQYHGICGIDFLISNDEIYFLEINPRFQGSSFLIEKSLAQSGLSLFQLNIDSFYKPIDNATMKHLSQLSIPYSFKKNQTERVIMNTQIVNCYPENLSTNYYDYFAEKYHIMLKNWTEKVDTQGKVLKQILNRYTKIKIKNILDCTCGIGIQALSLAQEGLNVTGSDLSQNELDYAKREAQKRNLDIRFIQADCRYLENIITEKFDAVIAIDSALPHLLTKENFLLAFRSIHKRLNKGGVFISSYRDYEALLKSKPEMAYPVRFNKEDDIEYTILRKWNWEGEYILSKQYVIADSPSESKLYTSTYKQWAVTKTQLSKIVAETDYSEYYWLLPEESGFTQPILCLVK